MKYMNRSFRAIIRRIIRVLLIFLISLYVLASPAALANESVPFDVEALDAYVSTYLQRTGVPGVSIAVVRDGEAIYVKGYGHDSEGIPVVTSTPMRIASLSKSFTALGVMQLVEKGKINLDTPVYEYVPEFSLEDERYKVITVRHLLNQASGLTDTVFPEMSAVQASTLVEAVERIEATKLAVDPGTEWFYHNPNYQILALLIQEVSGESYEEYLQRNVFQPLGMRDTFSADCGQEPDSVSNGYILVFGKAVSLPEPDYFCTGSGSVISTAEDMAKWLSLHQGTEDDAASKKILSKEGIELLHTVPDRPILNYGMGWYNQPSADGGPVRVSHSGVVGTFSAYQGIFTDSGYGIVVLQNAASPFADPYVLANGIFALTQGEVPIPIGVSRLVIEILIGIAVLCTLIAAVTIIRNARKWAVRNQTHSWWRNVAALFPYALIIILFALLPKIGSTLFGRSANWTVLLYSYAAPVVLLGTVTIMALLILSARLLHLLSLKKLR